MSKLFVITPLEWVPTAHGPEEVRQTSAVLRFTVNDRLVTRVDNDWAKAVDSTVYLSAYPLAIWLVSSWWRLHWEPIPTGKAGVEWRMAHEMGSAGHGFLWPPVWFESDGEMVTVHCTPSSDKSTEPIRYLSPLHESVPSADFTKGIVDFVQTVVDRLDSVGVRDTELHTLWREVGSERADPEAAAYRKMEALLGFEPDEGPETIVETLLNLSVEVGEAAVAEIAAGTSRPLRLNQVLESARSAGLQGNLSGIYDLTKQLTGFRYTTTPPWDRGRSLARAVREHLKLYSEPVSNHILSEMSGLVERDLTDGDAPMAKAGLGLAIKSEEGNRVNLLFRRNNPSGRRFEVARWMADALLSTAQDRWLPATDAKTARQQAQRAFAAEFLSPIGALQTFLGDDLTDEDRIGEVGNYFGVSPQTIQGQLTNHHLVPRDIWYR